MNALTSSEIDIRVVDSDRALAPAPRPENQPQLAVQQFSWQSRFGPMLIEVRGDAVYVNGQRVEQAPPGV